MQFKGSFQHLLKNILFHSLQNLSCNTVFDIVLYFTD
jgi:hypothetical protein